MRIALVIQKLIAASGGAETWTVQLANWLVERGHEVHCYCARAAAIEGFERLRIHTLNDHRNRFAAAAQLCNRLSSESYDIIHDMGYGTNFDLFQSHFGSMKAIEQAKWNSNSPVRRIANRLFQPFSQRKRRLASQSARQFSHPTAWFIAVSKMVAEALERLEGVPSGRIFTIENGVDAQKFHPSAIARRRARVRSECSIDTEELVLVAVAHNHRLKGIPQLAGFLRRAPDLPSKIRLVIAGGHHQTPKHLEFGKHSVTYLGPVAEPLDAYAMADIFIHPTFYDACSLTVLEAMACGLPTITSRCNGAAERIEDGRNGFLIQSATDADGMRNALRILAEPETRRRVGRMAHSSSRRWTMEDNFRSIEELYEARIVAKAGEPQPTSSVSRLVCLPGS